MMAVGRADHRVCGAREVVGLRRVDVLILREALGPCGYQGGCPIDEKNRARGWGVRHGCAFLASAAKALAGFHQREPEEVLAAPAAWIGRVDVVATEADPPDAVAGAGFDEDAIGGAEEEGA